jgi:hypothetical protein
MENFEVDFWIIYSTIKHFQKKKYEYKMPIFYTGEIIK